MVRYTGLKTRAQNIARIVWNTGILDMKVSRPCLPLLGGDGLVMELLAEEIAVVLYKEAQGNP